MTPKTTIPFDDMGAYPFPDYDFKRPAKGVVIVPPLDLSKLPQREEAPIALTAEERNLRSDPALQAQRYRVNFDGKGRPIPVPQTAAPSDSDFVWVVVSAKSAAYPAVVSQLARALKIDSSCIEDGKISTLHDAADHGEHGFVCLPFMKKAKRANEPFGTERTLSHFYALPSGQTILTVTHGFEFAQQFFPKAERFIHQSKDPAAMLMYGHLLEMATSTRDLLNDFGNYLIRTQENLNGFEARLSAAKFGAEDQQPKELINELSDIGVALAKAEIALANIERNVLHQIHLLVRLKSPAHEQGDFLKILKAIVKQGDGDGFANTIHANFEALYAKNFEQSLATNRKTLLALQNIQNKLKEKIATKHDSQANLIEQVENLITESRTKINGYWGYAAAGFLGLPGLIDITNQFTGFNNPFVAGILGLSGVAIGVYNFFRIRKAQNQYKLDKAKLLTSQKS